jgi:uncharacterized protein (TIGR02118 family)
MIKRVSLVRRKDDMTHEEFLAHWSGPHVAIVRELPGLRGLRLNPVHRWSDDAESWDGIGELWFDSIEAAESAFASEPFASRLAADRAKFLGEARVAFVEETTIVPPSTSKALS